MNLHALSRTPKSEETLGILQSEHYHAGYFESDLPASQERHLEVLFQHQSLRASDRVVDVGCGQGNTARWIRRRFGSSVVGVDILDAVLRRVDERDDLPLAQAEMAVLPLRSHCADLIVAVESLYCHPHRELVFAEFARVLRPGGTMLLSEFLLGDEPQRYTTRVVSAVVHSNSLSTEAVYKEQLRAAGFADVAFVDVAEFTAVGTADFLKTHARLRHKLFRAQLGSLRGPLFSTVGFRLFYRLWCDSFTRKRARYVFLTARLPDDRVLDLTQTATTAAKTSAGI